MNLRNRSLLVLGATFFIFFIIIAALSLSVTLSGLDRIEYQAMGESMNQVRSAVNAEASALLITTHDWAWWDDMYDFSRNQSPDFLQDNANPAAMATLRMHLFMILDNNGNLLYGRVLSPDFSTDAPVPADLQEIIRNDTSLWSHTEDDPGISGILLSREGPFVFASSPILHSDRTGPVSGTVIMGRYAEYGPIQQISDMTGYRVTLDWAGKDSGMASGRTGNAPGTPDRLSAHNNLVLVPENETVITGYSLLSDITGREMVLGISTGRELHRIGFANITTYLLLLVLWAIMTGFIVVVVMDRTVLQRMGTLTEHFRSLADNTTEVPAPVLTGNDELVELEATIIESRRNLQIRQEQLRVFVNAMPGPAALFARDGTILMINPAFAEYLGNSAEAVVGTHIRTHLPGEELEKYNRFVQEAIMEKKAVHFENETRGKTYLMSYYPVLSENGEVIQLGFLTFDISERKRLENALQKVNRKVALLNTVIFTDIQNKVFVQMGYLELARQTSENPRVKTYLEKEEAVVKEIQASLSFARQFNDMGMSPPRWQHVQEVILFAVSHLELGAISREFHLEGIEIYADPLLERVFVTLIENTIRHATGATLIRAGYSLDGEDVVIFVGDNGPGIPDDKKEEIFSKGAGAGGATSLFLSREILSITGITIRENGIVGKGARFEIRVPKGTFRFPAK